MVSFPAAPEPTTTTAPVTTPESKGENKPKLGYTSIYANIEPGKLVNCSTRTYNYYSTSDNPR